MKSFFKMMFASCFGFIIGSIVLSILSVFVFIGMMASLATTSSSTYILEKQSIFKLDLTGEITERKTTSPFDAFMGGTDGNAGLNDILNAIKKAKENKNIEGIYVKAGNLYSGIATLEPIRNALIDFKESGKFIVAYGDNYGQGAYYVASIADKIIMNPQGAVNLHGLNANIEFYKGALDKMGVKMQIFKVGTYKSAVEPYMLDKMSDANRAQVTSFLNDVWGHIISNISESRNISSEDLNRYADEYLDFGAPETMVEYGLVDTLMFTNELEDYLKELVDIDSDKDLRLANVENLKGIPFADKKNSKDEIAILYAEGAIVDSEMKGFFADEHLIVGQKYVDELIKLRDDENVKAVVFRVNSGGGSAYASEQIWNAVKEVKKVKPVVVSMGDYAASGGYYISCEATKIVAEPTTLTGSIGIFGRIPEGEELAKKLGLSYDGVGTNKHSKMFASGIPFIGLPIKPFDEAEKRMIQTYVERGYDLFLTRCADGRSKTKAEIDSVGQGRVWTGNQALALGLVDELGGLNKAVKIAAEAAEITDYRLDAYPQQKDFFTRLLENSFSEVKIQVVKTVLGDEKFEQAKLLKQLENYDYRQAVMPYQIKN